MLATVTEEWGHLLRLTRAASRPTDLQRGLAASAAAADSWLMSLTGCAQFSNAQKRHLILDRSSAWPFSIRSMMRPGVPTAMSMPRRSCDFWLAMGAPAGGQGLPSQGGAQPSCRCRRA
jgi:hypothetical protein